MCGSPQGRVGNVYNAVKVFSATLARKRETLGERVTQWIADNPDAVVVDKIVTQSSDAEFHCVTITLFYREPETAARV